MTKSYGHSPVTKFVSLENQRSFHPLMTLFSIGNYKSYIADNLLVIVELVNFTLGFTSFFVFYMNHKSLRFSATSIKTQDPISCNTHF